MVPLLATAMFAFGCGFIAAALLQAGRRQDSARAGGLLAQTVDDFTRHYSDRSCDVGGRVSVARSELDRLDHALETRDELLSA